MAIPNCGPAALIVRWISIIVILSSLAAPGWARPREVPRLEPDLETELLRLVNFDRTQSGLASLNRDRALSQVARNQSLSMAQAGKIGHDLPSLGNLEARLDTVNYSRRISRENLARAVSVRQAENAFIRSPAHKRNLFADDVSRIGIGIARGLPPDNDLYITQIFVEPAVLPSMNDLRESLLAQINDLRNRNGMLPVKDHPAMGQLAAASVRDVDLPFSRNVLARLLVENRSELERELQIRGVTRLAIDVQMLRDAKDLRVPEHLRQEGARAFGTSAVEVLDLHSHPVMVLLSFVALE